MECDHCGEIAPVRDSVDLYGQSFGIHDYVCEACYDEQPEPDTGRPDWDQLGPVLESGQ